MSDIKIKIDKIELDHDGMKNLLLSEDVKNALWDNAYKIGEPIARYGGINRGKVLVASNKDTIESMGIETRTKEE